MNAVTSEAVQKLILPQMADTIPMSPEDFAKKIASDIARVSDLVNEAKIDLSPTLSR